MKEIYSVNFIFTEDLGKHDIKGLVLGCMDLKNNVIKISNTLETNSHRWRFTLAHEIGHYILHSKFISKQYKIYNEYEKNFLALSNNELMDKTIWKKLEWQANMFSNCMLMPKSDTFRIVERLIGKLNIKNFSNGIIYVDDQICNIHNFNCIISKLKITFNVSASIAAIRLRQLRILNDVRTVNTQNMLSAPLPCVPRRGKEYSYHFEKLYSMTVGRLLEKCYFFILEFAFIKFH
ncbi:ImmA/IrrE family metallo-endopeptidase [Xenorhabdus siamensis]|uniref:ImmA/IrrE family metallo-endopeptidase n=1 Tax=Xenorhabdus siamensis TaxID=3136254 RepID=UPI0030F4887F